MPGFVTKKWNKTALAWFASVMVLTSAARGQNDRCDPNKVVSSESCAKCHVKEIQVWKQTPHFRTFEELGRQSEAHEICSNLGLRSIKRSDVCIGCHFTAQATSARIKPISGVSCESCHGAAKDWIAVHNEYGSPMATKEMETLEHAQLRLENSTALGMSNTRDLYSIASSCFHCHTVPNEELVNVGGHKATGEEFELVSWSQGQVRHNFLRTNGQYNSVSSPARIRVMFVVGLIADLEYSTRATAKATSKSTYGINVANRAARTAMKLYEVQQKIEDPIVQSVLRSFASAELRLNNSQALQKVADEIQEAGMQFSTQINGDQLSAIDSMLPNPSQYK